MPTPIPILTPARRMMFCCLSLLILTPTMAFAGDLVMVHLASGRTLTAYVDRRTDKERLWLRFQTPSITLLRPIAWQQVESAIHNGNHLGPQAFRHLATEFASADSNEMKGMFSRPRTTEEGIPLVGRRTYAEQALEALKPAPSLHSVQFDTYLANWDGDVEADGLVVHVYPLDGHNELMQVDGTLEVTLHAQKRRGFHHAPHSRGSSLDRVGRWTQQIRPDHIGAAGAVYKLPFQAIHPEFNLDVGSHGLVHLKLAVAGHGVFEDSQDAVRIRRFSPLRDELQRKEGHRFIQGERTGRGRR